MAAVGSSLCGAVIAYEGFDTATYTDGDTINGLNGGTGWTSNWTVDLSANANNANRYQGSSSSMGYSDGTESLVTDSGSMGAAAAGSGGGPLRRTFTATTGTVWFSLLSVMTTDTSWNWELGLEGSSEGQEVGIQNYSSDSIYRLNINETPNNMPGVDPYDDPSDGVSAALLVGRIQNAGSGSADGTVDVWINPTDITDPTAGAAASGSVTGATLPTLSSFFFDKGATPEGFIDEIRIGTTMADVTPVPEPSLMGLLAGMAALGLVVRYRRRG